MTTSGIKKAALAAIILLTAAAVAVAGAYFYNQNRRQQEFEALPAAVLHDDDIDSNPISGVKAMQYFVYDLGNEKMLNEVGAEKVVYPASCTKLLTIMTALQYISPDELITAGEEASFIAPGSSIAYIKSGMTLSAEMLIEGMLLPSGNDAAYVLAAAAGRRIANDTELPARQAIETFVEKMNKYSKDIGMCGSSFTVPDGYGNEDNYSTLEDMAIISALAFKNETVSKYCGLYSDNVVYESGESNEWTNTNECLWPSSDYYDERICGLKTGSLDGYYNLIAAVDINGSVYIIGVFGEESKKQRFEDVLRITDSLE